MMLIRLPHLMVVIQVLIPGSQSKPQSTPNGDPPLCLYVEANKCQETFIKAQCINLCTPKNDPEICLHINTDRCQEAYVIKQCPQKCRRPAIGCGSYEAVAHIPNINERIRDASSASTLNDLGGTAALYKSSTDLRSLTHICGAILISEWHLLTAAHCLADTESSFSISLGQDDLNESTSPGADTYEIVQEITHPLFNKAVSSYHDIALMVTSRRVNFKANIWPFCLPGNHQVYTDYMPVQIAGWGKVDAKNKANTIQSKYVTLVERSRCEEIWRQHAPDLYNHTLEYDYQQGLNQNVLCAGRDGVDACEGDSGGPMTHQNSDGLKAAIGVISRGIGGCPKYPLLPAYYTNILQYVDWIYDNTDSTLLSPQHPVSTPKPADQWSSWSTWSACSSSCGTGQRSRNRECSSLVPINCDGIHAQTENCNNGQCHRNGGWSIWSPWSSCSVQCGGGQRNRQRGCNNPLPSHGGRDCSGPNIKEEGCNSQPCPDQWSSWSTWSACSSTCGTGQRIRNRNCTDLIPINCDGSHAQIENCNNGQCQRNDNTRLPSLPSPRPISTHTPAVPDCPEPWFLISHQCFMIVDDYPWSSWSSARHNCGTFAPGADLAQPDDIKALADHLWNSGFASGANFWLGGSASIDNGVWKWLNGSIVATGWRNGPPSSGIGSGIGGKGYCLTIWPGFGAESLHRFGCGQKSRWPYVCER